MNHVLVLSVLNALKENRFSSRKYAKENITASKKWWLQSNKEFNKKSTI